MAVKLIATIPESPLPEVADINALGYTSEDTLAEDAIASLRTSGGCIIRNLVAREELDKIERDVRPHLDAAQPWEGDFWPPQTRKVMGLMGKSNAFALSIVGNPVWQRVGKYFLTSVLENNWVGFKQENSVSEPQLNNTVVFSIGPGAAAQVLHRDDPIHHTYGPATKEHYLGRDNGIGFFVAGKRSTKANGATRFVPGSHLWDYSLPPPTEDFTLYAELEPGDGFMVLSGCYHGGSANTTADEERLLYSTFTTRGYLRQEENQYLSNDPKVIKELPIGLQKFAGYELSRPFMGWVDMESPWNWLHPEDKVTGELW
ncbi:phytanoyl-CoA dioxygenase family protein [Byssothecium circinans]|uniref:Phytanoyl-CoA dioxygenase family protein n=1 Tax=Byssothecium circinans TaxID=147558 RepID=A0A6A5U7L2_9PLEO|nr:phytanoyl-CoA dioxygenase family protein [Byssothecium circinans]